VDEMGLRMLRFDNVQVLKEIDGVVEQIIVFVQTLESPLNLPLVNGDLTRV